jgi:hypothetical protein
MADTEAAVRRDADSACTICAGKGWHHGWNEAREPVMVRCPCVDRRRLAKATGEAE